MLSLSVSLSRLRSRSHLRYLSIPSPASTLSYRIEQLNRDESVVSAFQTWMSEGRNIHHGDIFHTINRLRRLNLNKRALQVMEWVTRERPYKLRELDYAYLLEFTTKLHGVENGESLFLRVPEEYRNDLLYNNLVMVCLEKGLIRLSLGYMRKMRELGFSISPYVYNRLMVLLPRSRRKKSIPRIMAQMKADGVLPHVSTYNIRMKMEADEHDIEGLSKVFDEMREAGTEPNEITYCILASAHATARLYTVCETYVEGIEMSKTGTNWSTLDVLLILYGCLGKVEKLERTWKLVQDLPHVTSKSYVLAIEAFGRINCVDRAEDIWSQMKSNRQLKLPEHFNSIISVYCRYGFIDKATQLLKEMNANGCKPNAITYRHLALGCLKAGLINQGLKTLDMGKEEAINRKVQRSTPWMETTYMLLEVFAELGDLENAKKMLEEFKESKYRRYTFVYNAYLKAHVKAKIYDPNLLRTMILSGARPDDETYSLVRLIEQYKND